MPGYASIRIANPAERAAFEQEATALALRQYPDIDPSTITIEWSADGDPTLTAWTPKARDIEIDGLGAIRGIRMPIALSFGRAVG